MASGKGERGLGFWCDGVESHSGRVKIERKGRRGERDSESGV